MNNAIHHPEENQSNEARDFLVQIEPRALRTFTPSQAILKRSAGVFHWTPEGRRLYDYSSGVLVSNLGHNPVSWLWRFFLHMGWDSFPRNSVPGLSGIASGEGYFPAVTLTAYNA